MKLNWSAIDTLFSSRNRRERLLIASLLVLGLPLAALTLRVEPTWRAHRALEHELSTLAGQSARGAAARPADPNQMARAELLALQERLAQDQRAIGEMSRQLVGAGEMIALLDTLLARHPGVRIQAMRSLGSEAWRGQPDPGGPDRAGTSSRAPGAASASASTSASASASTSPAGNPPAGERVSTSGLFRHGVELELEGSWSALRGYLAEIERSPRRLIWGQLQLNAQEHPSLRMKLSLYTLSLESTLLQL